MSSTLHPVASGAPATDPHTPAPPREDAESLIAAGHECERQARLDDARVQFERALRSLSTDEERLRAPAILRWIARTYQRAAAFDEALDCLDASLASAAAYGDEAAVSAGINLEAIIRWHQGDLDEAKQLYLKARDTALRAGETRLAAMTGQNLGVIASVRGELDAALRYYQSSLAEYRALGAEQDICVALNNLGMLHQRLMAWQDAEASFREACAIADQLGDLEVATQLQVNLAGVFAGQHDWEQAHRMCEHALLLARARGVETALAEALKLSGTIARERHEYEEAERQLTAALEIAVARRNLLLQGEVERERAVLFRTIGRNRDSFQSLNRAHRIFSQLRANHDLAEVTRRTRELEADFVELARRWGESTESKDQYTQGHCERVADVACRMAAVIGFDETQMFWFRIGALLHDVGKLRIPAEVLNKPGRLSKEEWDLMKSHPVVGVELLSEIEFPWDVLPVVRSHHECWDGSGYPDGLVGLEIPLEARIACLADVYDALTTERSYKRALTHEEALGIMRRDVGRQFDPELFPVFEQVTSDLARAWPSAGAVSGTQGAAASDAAAGAPARPTSALDELTGLVTRRAYCEQVALALAGLSSDTAEVTIAVVDVDRFKEVNDTFGHLQGDAVLREVARVMRDSSRDGDVVARYAGDEFALILPGTTLDVAGQVMERLRKLVEQLRVPLVQSEEGHVAVTLSIGVATAPRHGTTFETLFAAADRALYEVKRRGRNGVAHAGEVVRGGKPRLDTDRFIGRDRELKRLIAHLDQCVRGEMQAVAIEGEAGIGKTTLLRRLEPEVRLRTGMMVFGRSQEPDVRPPYGPWVETITALHRMGAVSPRPWRELSRIVPALRAPGEVDDRPPGDKYELLDEIVEYLRAASALRPLVIVLDDMQWGDKASWDALEHAQAQLEDARLMFCLTIRSEDSEQIAASRRRISRSERFHALRLERLDQAQVAEWLATVLHQAHASEELSALLFSYSEGNPLFVVQILRELVEAGLIWYGGKRWEWSRVDDFKLPTAIEDLLARRLSRLSPTATAVLTVASVLGRSFDLETIEQATDVSEDALLDAIDEALKAGVVELSSRGDGENYTFAHGLLAEALRRGEHPRRLQRTRRRVAQAVETLRPQAYPEIATLYDQGGDAEKAYHYSLLAGARAADVYALDDAVAAYRIAARRASVPSERRQARLALIEVSRLAGRYAESEELCGELLVDAEDTLPQDVQLKIECVRLQLRLLQGESPRVAIERARQLLARASTIDAPRDRVELLMLLSEAHARLNELHQAAAIAQGALEQALVLGDDALVADTRVRFGTTVLESDPLAALQQFTEAKATYSARDNRYGLVRCLVNAGIARSRLGDGSEAEAEYQQAIRVADESHITDLGGLAALNLGVLCLRRGDYDDADALFTRAVSLFKRVRNEPRRLAALYNQANLARERGDVGDALGLYQSAAELAQELGLVYLRVGALAGSGLSALSLGMRELAATVRTHIEQQLEQVSEEHYQGRDIVEAFLLRHAVSIGGPAASDALLRARRAIEALSSRDPFAHSWLISECARPLLEAGWPGGSVAITQALEAARSLGARTLVRALEPLREQALRLELQEGAARVGEAAR